MSNGGAQPERPKPGTRCPACGQTVTKPEILDKKQAEAREDLLEEQTREETQPGNG